MLPTHDGAARPTVTPNPVPLQFNPAGVSGSQPNDGQHSTGDDDHAHEQPPQEPQAQAETDPDVEPEAEEPESDAKADLQADPQARGEVFDLEAGDERSVSAPDGEQCEPQQGVDGKRAGGPEVEKEAKNVGAETDPGADSGTGGGAA